MQQLKRKLLNSDKKRVIAGILIIVVLAMVINFSILLLFNKKNANNTLEVILNQVISRLDKNNQEEERLVESLKEEYIEKAKTVSYILDNNEEFKDSLLELLIIAGKMGIDEIHLFDSEGTIIGGTVPEYYGISFNDGEQISYFTPMLNDKTLTMCQDVTPNTAEKKSMMYAITWNETKEYMVQIGIEPKRLLDELKRNEISNVVSAMPAYEGIDIFVADKETGIIKGATDRNYITKNINRLKIDNLDSSTFEISSATNIRDGFRQFYKFRQWGENNVIIAYSTKKDTKNFLLYSLMLSIYLIIASFIIYFMFEKIVKTTKDRNDQMSILLKMADIYYSMHLIDLQNDTVKEYSASDKVREIVNKEYGATEMMRDIMSVTVYPEYVNEALEFTELTTLADRMVGKKIISAEFNGNQFGWVRTSFITIEADENGKPKKVIYVTRDIDRDKKKEQQLILRSHTDALTGILNRRAYEEDIEKYANNVSDDNLVFVSMDVNGLKIVNDTMGHSVGDELLLGASECIRKSLSGYGKIYRIGGDEFVAIIFVKPDEIQRIIDNLKRVVGEWKGDKLKSISISVGYVCADEMEDRNIRAMAEEADKRMYKEKSEYYLKDKM